MTLLQQLVISLTALLLILFGLSLFTTVNDARNYLQAQLESHAQDTATSLGVAIASTETGDIATIDAMVDAVFDRGYYQNIRFEDMSGNVRVNSEHPVTVEGVPDWFLALTALNAPEVATEVNRGWVPAGKLYVTSHLGFAYQNLWQKACNGAILFAFALLLAIIGLNILLRIVLKPLKLLENQANAICQRRFVVQRELPVTKDLRQMVIAMNRMAGKLQKLFNEKVILTEELRHQSVKDALTGILNNRAFEGQVISSLKNEGKDAGGSLMLIDIGGLDALHRNKGHKTVDELLIDIAKRLSETVEPWPDAIIGRRSLSQFSVFLPSCGIEENQRFAEGCFRALASLPYFVSAKGQERLHLASVTGMGESHFEALVRASGELLKNLHLQGHNNWQVEEVGDTKGHMYLSWSQVQWQDVLKGVFKREQIDLFAQKGFDADGRPLFREVLARLHLDNELVSAQAFLPMVERFELHTAFDQAVVNCLVRYMKQSQNDEVFCVNLSPRSIMDNTFYPWLLDCLKSNTAVSQRLILETSERILHESVSGLAERITALTANGCEFSLDHFGVTTQSLSDLDLLNIRYIKIDNSFVRGITDNQGNQFYIRTLAMLAGSRDITLLAQGVENQAEWEKLTELGVSGGQGYFLARPEQL